MAIWIFTNPIQPPGAPIEVPDPITPLTPGSAVEDTSLVPVRLEQIEPRSAGVYGLEAAPTSA